VEAALLLALLGMMMTASAPALLAALSRARVAAAARALAGEMAGLRAAAIATQRVLALRLTRSPAGYAYAFYADGDGDGVRARDIAAGIDRLIAGPRDLRTRFEGIDFGLIDTAIPEVPPATGVLAPADDPVRFGRSDIVSFTPLGTASSGTLYVSDGRTTVCAVVLYGRTGRIRTWRFDRDGFRWTR
jgi:hypothetical protein